MNLLEDLDKELSTRHLNDFEKVRYIYLKTCGLFSFDSRYSFTGLFSDDRLRLEIINKHIDITNVSDFSVVCHSYSRDVLFRTIRELTTASVKYTNAGGHSYVLYEEKPGVIWEMDATLEDLQRVKIGAETTGFDIPFKPFRERLLEIDRELGYTYRTEQDYLSHTDMSSTENVFRSISALLENSDCRREFSDAVFFVKWLLYGINSQFSDTTYVSEDYDFIKLLVPRDNNDFYCLLKKDDSYTLQQKSREECKKLTRGLRTLEKKLF